MRPTKIPCLSLLLLVLAATSAPADPMKEEVRDLGARDWKTRGPAYRTLIAKLDPDALPHLRRALPEYDFTGQYYGVVILDRYPRSQVRRTWRKLLESEVPYLRFAAATGLLRQGDDRGVDLAVAALQDEKVSASIRIRMLQRGSTTPHPRLLQGFRSLLQPGQNHAVLSTLIPILYRLQDREAMDRAEGLVDDDRPGVRAMAAAFLYALGRIQVASELAGALRQGVSAQEFAVVRSLLPANRRVDGTVLDAVAAHLEAEKNVSLLVQQIDFLGAHRHQRARHALEPFLFHADVKVAEKAFDVLVGLTGSVRDDTLRPLLGGDDVGRRLWAAEALRRRGDTTGVGAVLDALRSGTPVQRRDAATILSSFTMDLAVEPLIEALADESREVRAAAHSGLARLLGRLFPYRRLALGSTAYRPNADQGVRAAAIDLIHAWWRANRRADW